jgi:Fe2+ transport system protein FeoA
MYLSDLKVGQRAKLLRIGGGELHKRLVDIGLVPGAALAGGNNLSLSRLEAAMIGVEELVGESICY